jgi:microcystin degradation protein MlrC
LGVFTDPASVESSHAAGEGARMTLDLGGKSGLPGQRPFRHEFEVVKIADGNFTTSGPVSGIRAVKLGPVALLQSGGVKALLAGRRLQATEFSVFQHLDIEPTEQKILALKSSVHFRAAYQPIAEEVLVIEAPGGNVADPAALDFTRLRPGIRLRPLGPEFRPAQGS